jgi:hypothetical protein
MRKKPSSRFCSQKKRNKRKLCLNRRYFLYLFCAFLSPRENGALPVSSLERMAGTTRLELATSAVTEGTGCHFLSSPYCTQIWPSY